MVDGEGTMQHWPLRRMQQAKLSVGIRGLADKTHSEAQLNPETLGRSIYFCKESMIAQRLN